MLNDSEEGSGKFTHTIFFEKSVAMFAFDFGRADDGRDIAHEIKSRMLPSLAIALPVFLLGLIVYITFALVMAFFRATYVDFWGWSCALRSCLFLACSTSSADSF